MPKLTEADMKASLGRLPGWTVEAGSLTKTYDFSAYARCVLFVVACAHLAEQADHHPDILLTWGKVRVSLSTHSEGGITEKDVEMALKVESIL